MSAVMSRPGADSDPLTDQRYATTEKRYTSSAERSVDELDAEIRRLARQMNIECYRMLVLVREFDDRFGWKKWGHKSCAEWLAWSCGITPSTAREKVRTAHALRNLPAIAAAFAEGRLTYSKARALTRVANRCDEDLLLAYALNAAVAQVEERCRQIRNVAPESARHARRAWAGRSLTMWRDNGRVLMRFTVEVPVEEGELICRALDCAVAAGEVTTDVDPAAFDPSDIDPAGFDPNAVAESKGTSWRAQQADALVAIAKSYLDGGHGHTGGATADHYQVVVHVDGKALTGGAQPLTEGTQTVSGGMGLSDLPIDTVKRLLCDCSLVVVAEDEHGKPLDVGRKQRTVSTALRRALYARDRGCTFPGCHRNRYCDGHHLEHWIHHGETVPANMTLLCTFHHGLLHRGAFRIVKEADETLRFVTADGRTIPRGGYRLEDFVDDDIGERVGGDESGGVDASREGFCTTTVQQPSSVADEVREPAAIYRLMRNMKRASSKPASYKTYIGIAINVIEKTSVASSIPTTNAPRKTYGRAAERLRSVHSPLQISNTVAIGVSNTMPKARNIVSTKSR